MVPKVGSAPKRNWASFCLVAGLVLLASGILFSQFLTIRADSSGNAPAGALIAEGSGALAMGQPARAVLDYERARLLAPRSALVRGGLARARSELNLPPTEPALAGTSAQLLRADQWGWIALVGLSLGAAGMVGALCSIIGRWGLAILLALGGTLAGAGIWGVVKVSPPPNLAVVIEHDAVARVAPSAEAEGSFIPHEGSLVTIERSEGEYSLISTAGRHGWVRRTGLEMLLPSEGHRS